MVIDADPVPEKKSWKSWFTAISKSSPESKRVTRKWSTGRENRAAGFHRKDRTSHAQCGDASQSYQTSLRYAINNLHSRLANQPQLRLLIRPQHHLLRVLQTILVEVHHIMASRLLHQRLISCLHRNDPAERVMWKILHHLTPLSDRYSKLWKINPRNKMCHPVSALSRLPLPEIRLCYIWTPHAGSDDDSPRCRETRFWQWRLEYVMLENCKKKNIVYCINHRILAMITSKYIDIIYFTGDLVLICKYCYYINFENCILQFSLSAKGMWYPNIHLFFNFIDAVKFIWCL